MPLAICGLLLTSGALVDLIIVRILPQVDDILHNSQQDQRRTTEDTGFTRLTLQKPRQPINASTVQLAALYNEVWTFIAGLRFCFFFVVSLYIYTGRSSVSSNGSSATSGWEGADTLAWSSSSGDAGVVKSGLDQIRSRVVFTYTFVEMMFWLWVCFFFFSRKGYTLMNDVAGWLVILDSVECARRTTGSGRSSVSAAGCWERKSF